MTVAQISKVYVFNHLRHSVVLTSQPIQKPNLLIDDTSNTCLTDFGLTLISKNHPSIPFSSGTARWAIPEIINRAEPSDRCDDLWDPQNCRPKRRNDALSTLNAAIEYMDLAKQIPGIAPARAVFASAETILTLIMVCLHSATIDFHSLDIYSGVDDQRTGMRRTGVTLC
jgi:serine/threonine protein kinase